MLTLGFVFMGALLADRARTIDGLARYRAEELCQRAESRDGGERRALAVSRARRCIHHPRGQRADRAVREVAEEVLAVGASHPLLHGDRLAPKRVPSVMNRQLKRSVGIM
jgi:hypothetical protein